MLKGLIAAAACAVLAAPATAAEPVRGVTDTEIVIGSYTDLSGVTAVWGVNNNNAWRMMFDAVNAQGGIDPKLARDGVHPTPAGYAIMAPLAQQAIDQALAH